MFYSERIIIENFEDTIEGLVKDYNLKVTYLSSDVEDTIKLSNVKNLYIGKGIIRTIFFSTLKCKNFILTLSDLDNYYLKKSKLCQNYIYIFHSAISTHKGYTKKAFWHYDTIFCISKNQVEEINKAERYIILNLKE